MPLSFKYISCSIPVWIFFNNCKFFIVVIKLNTFHLVVEAENVSIPWIHLFIYYILTIWQQGEEK